MCGTCAAAITSPTTSDSDGLPEPHPRAFIVPKADRAQRERGLVEPVERKVAAPSNPICEQCGHSRYDRGNGICRCEIPVWRQQERTARANHHPTVKPIDLMRHLVRLVTPVEGVVLDPFLGSGTTALAASEEGFRCIGIEREPEYLDIAKGRLVATPMGLGLDAALVGNPPTKTRDSNNLTRDQRRKRNDDRWVNQQWAQPNEEPAA